MKKVSLAILILISLAANAQKPPIKFGDIPMEDMKMTVYPNDSSAGAVILADYGESSIVYDQTHGFQIKFDRIRRIKILTKDGLEWADFSIQLYHEGGNYEKLSGLKAITYNLENGKVVETKLKSDDMLKEKYDVNFDLVKIPFKNAKVGSILEIYYTVMSDFLFHFQNWEFQSTIPARWSEYRVKIPEYFFYEKYMQGYIPLEVNEESFENASITLVSKGESDRLGRGDNSSERIDYKANRYRWAAKSVPAFKPEPNMTTYRNFISKMNFELSYTKFPNTPAKQYMGSWQDINRSYYQSVKEDITGNNSLKEMADQLTAGKNSDEEKISAISDFVKKNVVWDGGSRKYPINSMKKVLDEKKGNSAEVNLLLACLLNKAGIEVNPVLLSTRDHGYVRETTPVSTQFNYVICRAKIGDKYILLDATDGFTPTGLLPERCLNGNGLLVSEQGFQWLSLQPTVKTRTVYTIDLTLDEEGKLSGKLSIDRSGYNSIQARKSYITKGEENYTKEFLGNRPWQVVKSEYKNTKEVQQTFKEVHELTIDEHITNSGSSLYLSPFILERLEKNPYVLEKRDYPVDFGTPFEIIYMIKINLPPTFVVDELPKSKVLALPGNAARYLYNIGVTGSTFNISSNLTINKSTFVQTEYPSLREFYNQVVAKQAEQIVLKKK